MLASLNGGVVNHYEGGHTIMSDKKRRNRGSNQAIAKYTQDITKAEKGLSHRKLKARALCTHTKEPFVPALAFREEGGKPIWICKICGERVDLNRISDEKLQEAINTVSNACSIVKLMSNDSEKDKKLIEEVIADIQLKVNAYLMLAYKTALTNGTKQNRRRNGNNRRSGGVDFVDLR
jgi:hypothetical protein